jgi:NTP pyrophosphatase (non-canonical NTP hydrolase)
MIQKDDKYIEDCLVTETNDFEGISSRLENRNTVRLLHAGLGVATEAAEIADILKKHVYYGKPLDKTHLKEEIGDVLYYLAIAIDALDSDFQTLKDANIAKLKTRYPDGFEKNKALKRDVEAEYRAMEDV